MFHAASRRLQNTLASRKVNIIPRLLDNQHAVDPDEIGAWSIMFVILGPLPEMKNGGPLLPGNLR